MTAPSFWDTLRRGFLKGLRTLAELALYIVPAVLLVTFLDASGWLDRVAAWFAPYMAWFGLPGEAALTLVAGNLIGVYAALGTFVGLGWTAKQLTVIAAMLAISHSLIIESAIVQRAGGSAWLTAVVRLGSAAAAGWGLNMVL